MIALDKGKGFEAPGLNGKGGLAVASMRERLRSVGGTLRIESIPLQGTTIRAQAPVAAVPARHGSVEVVTKTEDLRYSTFDTAQFVA